MNDKDIQMFAKMFVYGTDTITTEQTSREPIELKTESTHNGNGLFERHDIMNCSLADIEKDLTEQLSSFIDKVNKTREDDLKFSKAQKAELKRQEKLVKQLKKSLK